MHRGFTFIEMLIYYGLFSLLFVGVTETWISLAKQNATFMRLAKNQEALLFAVQNVDAEISGATNYPAAVNTINTQAWHTIAAPIVVSESTSSTLLLGAVSVLQTINHLSISLAPPWQLDYYYAQ